MQLSVYRRAVLSSRVRPGVLTSAAAAIAAVSVVLSTSCSAPQGTSPVESARSVVTSTTKVAGAGVLGNLRRPDESCAPEPAPLDQGDAPSPPTRTVNSGTDRGDVEVPADPQRIVALSGDQLDALCALGLQTRVVGAALADGSDQQPSYLGAVIHDLPGVGTRSAPDATAIAAASPDLILGSSALTPQSYGEFLAIAPTVFTGAPGPGWADNLRTVGAATGRAGHAEALITGFTEKAREVGATNDARHYQVSVVQLTDTTLRIFGAANFPADIIAAIGADRPASQRFTDTPYVELGLDDSEFSAADGDVIFVSFASPAAKKRAPEIMSGPAWRALSAAQDNRTYVVNNEIWQTGQGLIAARGILEDLRFVNSPLN
jgi:iron complex transport system substrate-binding protein